MRVRHWSFFWMTGQTVTFFNEHCSTYINEGPEQWLSLDTAWGGRGFEESFRKGWQSRAATMVGSYSKL